MVSCVIFYTLTYNQALSLSHVRVRKVHDDDKKDRVRDKEVPTFAIDPEQAETVRMIFDLYEEGLGLRRIQTHLLKEKRLNSSGECVWHMSTISRILENPIYTGKQRQHQTEVEDFLTGRKKHIPKEEQDQYKTNTPIEERRKLTEQMLEEEYRKLFDMRINYDTARGYRKEFGKYLREKQWDDIDVVVYGR